ncbi:MAG: DUF2283 domain-containing protein [Ignavibacteriae bacterium]|nr:DUF2283 domain-containing protein [Ignavibacteriota bacterium]
MKILYDKEVDGLYIELRDNIAHHNIDIIPGVSMDLDENNQIVGIEVLDASEVLKENLYDLEYHQVPMKRAV